MGTVLNFFYLAILFVVVIRVSRAVRNKQQQDRGSLLLSICATLAAMVFALVSLAANSGLVQSSSLFTRGLLLAFVVVMAILVRLSWISNAAG
jgi:SNF family Na+-dependent transporter